MKALEQRRLANADRLGIIGWQRDAFGTLEDMRRLHCRVGDPSVQRSPVLAFYIDYTLLLINTHAAGDLIFLGSNDTLLDLKALSQQSADVATRLMDLVLGDKMLMELRSGFHNCQLVMICHAAIEILNVSCLLRNHSVFRNFTKHPWA